MEKCLAATAVPARARRSSPHRGASPRTPECAWSWLTRRTGASWRCNCEGCTCRILNAGALRRNDAMGAAGSVAATPSSQRVAGDASSPESEVSNLADIALATRRRVHPLRRGRRSYKRVHRRDGDTRGQERGGFFPPCRGPRTRLRLDGFSRHPAPSATPPPVHRLKATAFFPCSLQMEA